MNYWYLVCLLLLVLGQLRIKQAKAALTPEQRAIVKNASAGLTKWTLLGLVAIFAVDSLAASYFGSAAWLKLSSYSLLLIGFVTLMVFELYQLSRLELPSAYRRSIGLGHLGLALLLASLGYSLISDLIAPARAEYKFKKLAAAVQKTMPREEVLQLAEQIGYGQHNLTLEGAGSVKGSEGYPIEKLFDVYVYKSYEHTSLVVVRYDDQARVKEINLYQ